MLGEQRLRAFSSLFIFLVIIIMDSKSRRLVRLIEEMIVLVEMMILSNEEVDERFDEKIELEVKEWFISDLPQRYQVS